MERRGTGSKASERIAVPRYSTRAVVGTARVYWVCMACHCLTVLHFMVIA